MKRLWWLALAGVLLMAPLACASGGTAPSPEEPVITGKGTVRFVDVEGGCWSIVDEEGRRYEPLNLPDAFRRDGLRVAFKARARSDVASACMVGRIIEILQIEALK
ncbi:MAG: hypothetical protein P8Y66_09345 [Nitrospirota bacterium]|jgi:hypothetical protein